MISSHAATNTMNCYTVYLLLDGYWMEPADTLDPRDPAAEFYTQHGTFNAIVEVWAETESRARELAEGYDFRPETFNVTMANIDRVEYICSEPDYTEEEFGDVYVEEVEI
jgi:hypothetical protein